ncbi:MAG TPA: amino acid adenylation domain-containing protein [Terracidiphilus sp.]|nr:amino acid adenylation domain-containing protein [Terracidiphilus sp.]
MTIQRMERHHGATSFPLSASQEQLWYLNHLAHGSPVYNVMDLIDLGATYNPQALRKVAMELVRRHETLRTAFSYVGGQPMQVVLPTAELELLEFDLTSLPETEQESEWTRVVREQTCKPFDLSQAPLIRWTVIHRSATEHRLLVVMHHIITDEWGTGILHKEITQLYEDFSRGLSSSLAELPIQYADFACWQRDWLKGEVLEKQLAYWKDELAGAPQGLELTTDKPRPAIQSFRGAWESFQLPLEVLDPLKSLGRQERATLFTTLLAGFMTLLYRYTGQDDILVGTPISLRRHSETENLVGYFLNIVTMRAQFREGLSFRSLLQQVRKRALGAIANAELPFNHLVAELAPERDPSRAPLFQVAFILHDRDGVSEVSKVSGKDQLGTGTSKFDLSLYVSERKDGMDVSIEYSTDLFEPQTIRRICGHFGNLLEAIGSNPDGNVSELAMLAEAERRQVVYQWNNTEAGYPKDVPLAQLIEQQVQRTPNAVAVVYGKQRITYQELNVRANRLAHQLRKLGAGPDETVGVYLERSTDMIVALLAIVKAGAAYLPLDPLFPPDRLGYMLEDSNARLLITQQSLRADLPKFAGTMVLLEDEGWQGNASDNLAIAVGPEHLAYLIYTSGSTGKPKGVEVPRGALTNLLWSVREWLQFSDRDRLLAVATISFDIAAADVWLPLVVGAQMVVASRESAADGNALRDLLEQQNITFLQATPITWRLLFEAGWRGKQDMQAVCTGEAMPPEVAAKLAPVVKRLWNLYGPTETTIWSTGFEVTDGEKKILIGRPLANTQCYILDAQRQPVPIGVTGELYIGGGGLARGYLNRPELTAEKFVADPFGGAEARMYRTGDLARYLPDGNIECLGRIDHQVKLRGFRIELGEIEARLAEHPAVREAVVVAREDTPGDKRLVAYYIASPLVDESEEGTVGAEQFRSHLSASLPDYMIPAAFVRLESLPLTPNGKLDRKALQAPEADAYSTYNYEPPQGEMEMELAAIWTDVLKLERVGRHDNFFKLGGHSLAAVQVVTRLRQALGVELTIRDLFAQPVLHLFAEHIINLRLAQFSPADLARALKLMQSA